MSPGSMAPRPIAEVAHDLGIDDGDIVPYGRTKAKVTLDAVARAPRGAGRLILVSAIDPTVAG